MKDLHGTAIVKGPAQVLVLSRSKKEVQVCTCEIVGFTAKSNKVKINMGGKGYIKHPSFLIVVKDGTKEAS
mgnify:CR=1 FL=1